MSRWLGLALAFTLWASPAHAQIALLQNLVWQLDSTDASSYTLVSHTVHAGALVLLAVYSSDSGGTPATNPDVTRTGAGFTYTHLASVVGSTSSLRLWCAAPTADDTNTTVVDFTAGDGLQVRLAWKLTEFTGVDLSGGCAAAVLQEGTVTINASEGATSTLTFAAYNKTTNRPYVVATKVLNTTATTDWTELDDRTLDAAITLYAAWDDASDDTTALIDWANDTSAAVRGLGVEMVAAGQAPRSMHQFRLRR